MNVCPDCNKSISECPYCRRQVCGCWNCNCELDEGNDKEMYDYKTKNKKCQHKFSIPVLGAIGMCDYCGIDEATAKKPVIVKEDTNEKNVRLLADIHINSLKEIKYRYNRAIEYAMYKTGKKWESNRVRLSFYEYFEESLRNEPKE